MPTFREDLHLGHAVPTVDTDDITAKAITEDKMADDSISTRCLQDGSVTEPKLADDAVSTRTIQDGAVTAEKLADGSVKLKNISDEVFNTFDSIKAGGIMLAQDFGERGGGSEVLGISQKKLTEEHYRVDDELQGINKALGEDDDKGTVRGRIKNLEDTIGEDENGNTVMGRLADLEEDASTVDARIRQAKNDIVNGASQNYDTLRELEERIKFEGNRITSMGNLIGGLNGTNIVVLSSTSELPDSAATAEDNTVYRVAGESSYTDYAWNGTECIPLATYGNADNIPTYNSDNLITSGGVYSTKRALLELITQRLEPSNGWPYIIASLTGIIYSDINNSFSTPSANPDNHRVLIYYFKKGTVIHYTAGIKDSYSGTGTFKANYGFITALPEYTNNDELKTGLLSLSSPALEFNEVNVLTTSNRNFDRYILVPYDGYFIRYYNTTSTSVWDTDKDVVEIYPPIDVSSEIATIKRELRYNILLQEYSPFVTYVNHDIDNSGTIIETSSSVYLYCYKKMFKKGDIIHFTGVADPSTLRRFCISDTDFYSSNLEDLYGATVEIIHSYSGENHDYDIIIPHDGYLVSRVYNSGSNWTSSTLTLYTNQAVKEKINSLQDSVLSRLSWNILGSSAIGSNNTKSISLSTWKVTTGSSSNYIVWFFKSPLSKGDIIKFDGEATTSKTIYACFTTINPQEYYDNNSNSLLGLSLDSYTAHSGLSHHYTIEVPFDNAYFVFYRHANDWTSQQWSVSYKNDLSTIKQNIASLNDNKMDATIQDYSASENIVWTTRSKSSPANQDVSVVTDDGITTVNIIAKASGVRFGVQIKKTVPVGKYVLEFDYEGPFNGSGTFYSKPDETNANTSVASVLECTYANGHYRLLFNKNSAGNVYRMFATNSWSNGNIITISNMTLTSSTKDISGIQSALESTSERTETLINAAIAAGACPIENTEYIVPEASETYNLMYRSSQSAAFSASGDYLKRLCYFPKYEIAGGGTVRFKYTGENGIRVYQLKDKEGVDIDTKPKDVYTKSEVVALPSFYFDNNSTSAFISNSEYDETTGKMVRTVSFVTSKSCKRIAFVFGSTKNVALSPSDITNNITEISFPYYNLEGLNFSKFAQNDELQNLKKRVDENEVPSTSPGSTTFYYYEMSAEGNITRKSDKKYRIVCYKKPFNTGDIIKFYGEDATGEVGTYKSQRWAFLTVNPFTIADLTTLTEEELTYYVPDIKTTTSIYNDSGDFVKHVYNHEIVVPGDNLYLIYYYHTSNWATRSFSYYYSGSIKKAVKDLEEWGTRDMQLISQANTYDTSAKRTNPNDPSGPTILLPKPLNLLHYSDIHGDSVAAKKILEWADLYSDYIDDVVTTGDVVYHNTTGESNTYNNINWWYNSGLAENSLFVLGNHDCATPASTGFDQKEDSHAWNGQGKAWAYTNYFANFIDSRGLTNCMPLGYDDPNSPNYQPCYWYKDYPESDATVIGLDCMNFFDGVLGDDFYDNILQNNVFEPISPGFKVSYPAQEIWLVQTLEAAKQAHRSVIFMCHYPLDDTSTTAGDITNELDADGYNVSEHGGFVMNGLTNDTTTFTIYPKDNLSAINLEYKFNLRNRVADAAFNPGEGVPTVHYTKGSTNNIGNIIRRFIDTGGEFVVWLCGHYHSYHMFYPKGPDAAHNFSDMLNIVVGEAGNTRTIYWANRPSDTPYLRTLANYLVIDTYRKRLKIIRLGLSTNNLLRSCKYLCYDYKNRRVISER